MRRFVILPALVVLSGAFVFSAAPAHAQGANAFNRLHTGPGDRNAPPTSDSIHDSAIDGTRLLQHPKDAFDGLPKASSGNYVDWGEALKKGNVVPRYDAADDKAKPEILDLDIVREVRGTTPDVVFPHAAHAQWVDCPVCHPALFEASRGANTMTMAEIMVGQKCGVCHGTVAFPVAECRRCHNRPKAGVESKVSVKEGSRAKKSKGGLRMPWSRRDD